MIRKALHVLVVLGAGLLALPSDAATQFTCGGQSVSIFNSNIRESPFFVLNIEGVVHFPFFVENEYFAVRCEKDRRGRDRILILHTCGGSGCADRANFGIVDPRTGKVLLQPTARYRGNWNKAEAILGKKLRAFTCEMHSTTSTVESQNGEYCFMSPLELS